jgi:A/G-specific adenine glycosylase
VAARSAARRTQVDPTAGETAIAANIGADLEEWYRAHGRVFPWREFRDTYRLTVTEVLLQRTRAEVVALFLPGFLSDYPDWPTLASATTGDLAARLAPIGLQARRAAVLQRLARAMEGRDGLPDELDPGVGQYIARAVRVAANGDALAMVDANFVRVLTRYFAGPWMADYRYDRRLQGLANSLISGAADPRAANWGVLDLGAAVCRPRVPDCVICPLHDGCRSAPQSNATANVDTP